MYEPEVLLLDESTSALDTKIKKTSKRLSLNSLKGDSDSLDYS